MMNQLDFSDVSSELDEQIEAFEIAWVTDPSVDIADYLPPTSDPRHRDILVELIRVDMEHCHVQGQHRSVIYYCQRFPQLADDLQALQLITFEEERLHREFSAAGNTQTVDASEEPPPRASTPVSPLDYEIERELGAGGMGVVYLAIQKSLDRRVALKMIRDRCMSSPYHQQRFVAEARALGQLKHPNIVRVFDIGEIEGRPYFAMEYVEGCSLRDHLQLNGAVFSAEQAARLIQQMADAMDESHLRGLIHRDLKPGNVLLQGVMAPGTHPTISTGNRGDAPTTNQKMENQIQTDSGAQNPSSFPATETSIRPKHQSRETGSQPARLVHYLPKITDFGLVKNLFEDNSITRAGSVMGTPSYMPPEQARGQNWKIGPASDIYSLGAILYELMCRQPPFSWGDSEEILLEVITKPPLPLHHLRPDCPKDLEMICLKCLEKDPRDRYRSSRELADDLGRFLNNEPVRARATPWLEQGVKWLKRHPMLASLIAVIVLSIVGLGVTGWLFFVEQKKANQRLAESQASTRRALASEKVAHEETKQKEKSRENAAKIARASLHVSEQSRRVESRQFAEYLSWQNEFLQQVIHNRRLSANERRRLVEDAQKNLQKLVARSNQEAEPLTHFAWAATIAGQLYQEQGNDDRAIDQYLRALALYKGVELENDSLAPQLGIALCEHHLGVLYLSQNDVDRSRQHLDKALTLRTDLARQKNLPHLQAGLVETLLALGGYHLSLGETREAEKQYQDAIARTTILAKHHSQRDGRHRNLHAQSWSSLGDLHVRSLEQDQAMRAYQQAAKVWLRIRLVHPDYQRSLARAHDQLGLLALEKEDIQGASTLMESAKAMREVLASRYPEYQPYHVDLAESYNNLGQLYHQQKDYPQCLSNFKLALLKRRQFVHKSSDNVLYQQQLAQTHNNLGVVYSETQELDKAETHYNEALKVHQKLAGEHEKIVRHQLDLASAYSNLGVLRMRQQQWENAEKSLAEAEKIARKLGEENEENAGVKLSLAGTCLNLGRLYRETKEPTKAHRRYDESVKLLVDLQNRSGALKVAKTYLERALIGRAGSLTLLKRYSEAMSDWNAVLSRTPEHRWSVELGRAGTLARSGDHQQAVRGVEEALKSEQKNIHARFTAMGVLCLASVAAGQDQQLTNQQRADLSQGLVRKAWGHLQWCSSQPGFKKSPFVQLLKENSELLPLRKLPEFSRLLLELEQK